MRVAIIIVTYNGAAYIEKCIQSLLPNTGTENRIIVVDNNSADNTMSIVKVKFPMVVAHQCNTNLGFGQANNIGFKLGLDWGADYFFLLNQDAWITDQDGLKILAELAERNEGYGIVSPLHLNSDQSGFDHGFINHISRTEMAKEIVHDATPAGSKALYPVSFVNAAAWLIARKCLEKVGGFAPIFFHYGEDDNYVHRVLFHGFKVGITTSVRIVHERKQGSGQPMDTKMLVRNYLINACDINKEFESVRKEYDRHFFISAIKNFLQGRFKLGRTYFRALQEAHQLENSIKTSRNEMMRKQLSAPPFLN